MIDKDLVRIFDFKKDRSIEIEIIDLKRIQEYPKAFDGVNKATFLQLIWVSSGVLRIDVDFNPIHIYEGEIFLISINQVFNFKTDSQCEGKLIIFTNDFFSLTELDNHLLHWSELFNPLYLNPKIKLDNSFIIPFMSLMEAQLSRRPDFYQSYEAQSFLRILLIEIERSLNTGPVKKIKHLDMRIGRLFCDSVGRNFKTHHNISFYKDKLNVSEKNLLREVKEFTNKTPKEYLDSRIILEAKRLLSYGKNFSIKEIGIELGFDEPTNFNKFFKKHTGITPMQFKTGEKIE